MMLRLRTWAEIILVAGLATISTLAALAPAYAKEAAISGHVADVEKAAVGGVHVKAMNEKTKVMITTETNADGDFALSHVSSGIYDVTFLKDGFEFLLYPHVVVKKDAPVKLDVTIHRPAYTSPK
jgi:hypothetical protein